MISFKNPIIAVYLFSVLLLALLPKFSAGQSKKEELLLKKNFYLLYLLAQSQRKDVAAISKSITTDRTSKLRNAINNCTTNSCLVSALQLTNREIQQFGSQLIVYAAENPAFLQQLRASKYYVRFDVGSDSSLIRQSWELNAQAMNKLLSVYVGGEKPIYPKIDAGSFDPKDEKYFKQIKSLLRHLLAKEPEANGLPHHTLMLACLKVLLVNGRDEAVRYEPLEKGFNKTAVKQITKTNWAKYPYSVILVPGLGPEQEGLKLDPNGAKRCDSAAKRYFSGLAPFIAVSGGHVHPNKTPYNEAIEMKKYMIKSLKVPASAILIEPHARHTTTNLRNLNRMIFRFKMPVDKKILIVTDASQSSYILGNMKKNVLRELGYLPFINMKSISTTETDYLPNEMSLQVNPLDPLDPR